MADNIRSIPIARIDRTIHAIRDLPDPHMGRLQESIEVWGQWTPILVRKLKPAEAKQVGADKRFTAISGHRRCFALEQAGQTSVTAIVLDDLPVDTAALMAFADNLVHRALTPLEEAQTIAALAARGFKQEEIARGTGVSQGHVSLLISILAKSPQPVLKAFDRGEIPLASIRELCRLPNKAERKAVFLAAADSGYAPAVIKELVQERLEALGLSKRTPGVRTVTSRWESSKALRPLEDQGAVKLVHRGDDEVEVRLKGRNAKQLLELLEATHGALKGRG